MLEAQEGRMFGPLAFTKTFILIAALVIVLTLIPAFAHWLFSQKVGSAMARSSGTGMILFGTLCQPLWMAWAGLILIALGVNNLVSVYREGYQVVTMGE
jgi:copper/silver efflux system protein